MQSLTRRRLLRSAVLLCKSLAGVFILGACRERIVHVEKIVRVPEVVTKVVTEIVRETVVVEETQLVERTVEKVVTSTPAPKPRTTIVADVLDYGWTQFGMRMSAAFEEMFPNVTIVWRSLSSWHEYPQRIAALHASDQLGDLIEAPFGVLPRYWAQQEVIQSIDEIIESDGFDTSGIFKGAMDACLYAGQHIGLPFISHAGENILLYNPDLFDQASAERPSADWTLDDLVAAASVLTVDQDGNGIADRFGYAIRYNLPGAYPMLSVLGAELLSKDGKRCAIESENGVACLEWAYEIHQRQLAPRSSQIEGGGLEMFRTGRLAMVRHSLKTFVAMRRIAGDNQNIEAVLYPRHPITGKLGGIATGMAYCITRNTRIPEQVFQWIKLVSGREMGVQMFLRGYAEPGCRSASWKDPRVLEGFPICAQIADSVDGAGPERLPWNLRIQECLDAWNKRTHALLLDEIKPDQCAQAICEDIQEVLAALPLSIKGLSESS